MSQYRVLARSFINDRIVEPGAVVDIDAENFKYGENLEPVEVPKVAPSKPDKG